MKSLRLVNFVKPVETADLAPSQNLTIVHDPKFNDTKGSNDYWYPGKPVIIFSIIFLHLNSLCHAVEYPGQWN
jgi:hypothetical protein